MFHKVTQVVSQRGFQQYLRNTGWLLFEQILRVVSGLLVGFWIARFLGPEQFGVFSYVVAFIAIFTGIAKVGLDSILVRELVDSPNSTSLLMGTALWLKIFGAVLAIAVIVLCIPLSTNDEATNFLIIIAALGLIFQALEVVDFYFQSKIQVKVVSLIRCTGLLLSASVKIYLILMNADLFWFVATITFDSFFLAICYFFISKSYRLQSFALKFDLTVANHLLREAWPLLLSTVVVGIYMRIDQVMIKEMLGDYDVGIYSAAVRISEGFYFIPMLITSSLFPAILNARSVSKSLYLSRIQRLYVLMTWMAIIIGLVVTFVGEALINLTFGEDYLDASAVLLVHVWAAIFVFIGVSFDKCLIAEGLSKIAFTRALSGVFVNVALNLILIPDHGILGAAFATLAAQFFANVGYDLFDSRLRIHLRLKLNAFFRPWVVFKDA